MFSGKMEKSAVSRQKKTPLRKGGVWDRWGKKRGNQPISPKNIYGCQCRRPRKPICSTFILLPISICPALSAEVAHIIAFLTQAEQLPQRVIPEKVEKQTLHPIQTPQPQKAVVICSNEVILSESDAVSLQHVTQSHFGM